MYVETWTMLSLELCDYVWNLYWVSIRTVCCSRKCSVVVTVWSWVNTKGNNGLMYINSLCAWLVHCFMENPFLMNIRSCAFCLFISSVNVPCYTTLCKRNMMYCETIVKTAGYTRMSYLLPIDIFIIFVYFLFIWLPFRVCYLYYLESLGNLVMNLENEIYNNLWDAMPTHTVYNLYVFIDT